jgi:membrane-associated phospholipid phosphatase
MKLYNTCRHVLLAWVLFFGSSLSANAQNADIDLLRQINLHRDHSLQGVMTGLTNYDYPVSIAIPLTELVAGYSRGDTQAIVHGVQTTAGFAIDFVLTYGLKYAVNRPRPFVTYPYLQPYERYTDQSFPSGHTSFAFCAATSLSICYPRWYVIVPAYLWASAIGYSRLYLGVHYPSDVLAGAVVGAGSSWLTHMGTRWLQKKKPFILRKLFW